MKMKKKTIILRAHNYSEVLYVKSLGIYAISSVFNQYIYLFVQEKVYEEQCNIFKGEDRPVTGEDMDRMEYTEQVIKETLRMFPVVPLILRAVEEDLKISE